MSDKRPDDWTKDVDWEAVKELGRAFHEAFKATERPKPIERVKFRLKSPPSYWGEMP